MPVSRQTVVFDVNDAKVYPLLTDIVGAAPTYGPGFDVPGITEVKVDPNLVTAELKGDARVIAKRGRTDRYNFSGTYSKLDFNVLTAIQGGAITDVTTPARVTMRSASPARLPYFKLSFAIEDTDEGLGTLQVVMYKCQITGGSLIGSSSDNFGQPSFDAEAIALNGTLPAPGTTTPLVDAGVMVDWDLYAVATPLA